MTLNTLITTTMLFGIAASLWAFYFLISEIDRMLQQIRRPVVMEAEAISSRAIRIDGRIWDVPSHLNVKRGRRYLLVEA